MIKGQPPKTRVEQWSESAMLTLASRVAVIAGTPAMIGLLGWLLITTAANTTQIASLSATVNGNLALQNGLAAYMRHELDDFEHITKAVYDDHESRIRRLEHDDDSKRGH